ncbi:MAG: DUF1402 family protein, partial [Bdellovibrionales bacterium]|nr:DUF1402 family protein [Bdellovibrionales bacterium]
MGAIAQGKDIPFPKENYYGWFVNHQADELMAIYNDNTQNCN